MLVLKGINPKMPFLELPIRCALEMRYIPIIKTCFCQQPVNRSQPHFVGLLLIKWVFHENFVVPKQKCLNIEAWKLDYKMFLVIN